MVVISRPTTHRWSSRKIGSFGLFCLVYFGLGRIFERIWDIDMTTAPLDKKPRDWQGNRIARILAEYHQRLQATANQSQLPIVRNFPLQPCRYLFWDLGSNIGDAVHKVIDSFLPEIDDGYIEFNTTTGYIQVKHETILPSRLLSRWVQERISQYRARLSKKSQLFPEQYCFYGIEGNPHFTSTLQQMELDILHMEPRPLRHLHFLTGHVITSRNGPTTLYLDTTNVKMNYWGSSLLNTHLDVQNNEGIMTSVPVMGVTLTKLLEQTVQPSGGHVMIKVDIEGAEYAVLEEAIQSNILCKLVQDMGISVDILMEEHSDITLGSDEPRKRWESIVHGEQAIRACGVSLQIPKMLIPAW
jgi:FkbM family methyltransferase